MPKSQTNPSHHEAESIAILKAHTQKQDYNISRKASPLFLGNMTAKLRKDTQEYLYKKKHTQKKAKHKMTVWSEPYLSTGFHEYKIVYKMKYKMLKFLTCVHNLVISLDMTWLENPLVKACISLSFIIKYV